MIEMPNNAFYSYTQSVKQKTAPHAVPSCYHAVLKKYIINAIRL